MHLRLKHSSVLGTKFGNSFLNTQQSFLAIDVHYFNSKARAAAVSFSDWQASKADDCFVVEVNGVAAYESGAFYKRELPIILKLLETYKLKPEIILIDGYVFLDGEVKAGLGKMLYDALEQSTTVIGVAKNSFEGIGERFALYRGQSQRPLYVSSAGIDASDAKNIIRKMHGDYRLPTLLKLVDQLCRTPAGN